MTRRPKGKRGLDESEDTVERVEGAKQFSNTRLEDDFETFMDYTLGTEIWSVLFAIFVQDLPYATIRFYLIIVYDLTKNYTLFYMFGKNVIMCSLGIYKIVLILIDKRQESRKVEPKEVTSPGLDNAKSSEKEPLTVKEANANNRRR
jgi:hypothetical protein